LASPHRGTAGSEKIFGMKFLPAWHVYLSSKRYGTQRPSARQ